MDKDFLGNDFETAQAGFKSFRKCWLKKNDKWVEGFFIEGETVTRYNQILFVDHCGDFVVRQFGSSYYTFTNPIPEPKELTVEELERLLGYPIKVVK